VDLVKKKRVKMLETILKHLNVGAIITKSKNGKVDVELDGCLYDEIKIEQYPFWKQVLNSQQLPSKQNNVCLPKYQNLNLE
jgi:G3E family GTPase